jgi:hypothetical protein
MAPESPPGLFEWSAEDLPEKEQEALIIFGKRFGRLLEQTDRVCDKCPSVSAYYVIKNRHVTELAARYNADPYWGHKQMTSFPEEIFSFSQLESLYLDGYAIEEIPELIGTLTSLKYLGLALNKIWEIPKDFGFILPALEDLSLSGNRLRYLPDSMRNLKRLRRLYLSRNKLTDLPDWMDELPNLELVAVDRNDAFFPDHWFEELEEKKVKVITRFIDDDY